MAVQLLTPTKSASARRAVEAFKKLQTLSAEEGVREELAAAGVQPHRIEALYPVNYIAQIPAIIRHLGSPSADEVFNAAEAIRQLGLHVGLFPAEVNEEFNAFGKRLSASPEFEALKQALNDRFPLPKAQGVGEASLAMLTAYSFWMMERREKLGAETLQGVYELFFQTYNYLIPELAG